jgi:hypothetical protein
LYKRYAKRVAAQDCAPASSRAVGPARLSV